MELPPISLNLVQALSSKLARATASNPEHQRASTLISEEGLRLLAYGAWQRQHAAVKMGFPKLAPVPLLYADLDPELYANANAFGGLAQHHETGQLVSLSDLMGATPAVHLSELLGHTVEGDFAVVVDGKNATQQDTVIRVAGQCAEEHAEFLNEREAVASVSQELAVQGYRCCTSVLHQNADNTVCFDDLIGFDKDDYMFMYRQTQIQWMVEQAFAVLPESIKNSPAIERVAIRTALTADAAKLYDEMLTDVTPPELIMDNMARPVLVRIISPEGKTLGAATYCAYDLHGFTVNPSLHWRGAVFDADADIDLIGPALIGCAVYTAYSSDASLYVTGAPDELIAGWKPEQDPRYSLDLLPKKSKGGGSNITAPRGNGGNPLVFLLV